MPEFWICSRNNSKRTLNLIIQGKLWKKDIFEVYIWLKPEFFFQLWTIFFSCEFLERVWEMICHQWYCLAHQPGISFNITNSSHFSTPPAPSTLAHQPRFLHWHTTNGLSPIIMKEVFNFEENERYNLRSGIHLASKNMHTAYLELTPYLI